MFRKPTINTNKTINFIAISPFDSRLYLDISRSFKCPKFSPIWSVWFVFTWGRFASCYLYCEKVFKSSRTRQVWKYSYKIWNICILHCIYCSITLHTFFQRPRVAQWVRLLDLTAHKSLSPIRRGFAPSFVN